jgi:hypothetical protein
MLRVENRCFQLFLSLLSLKITFLGKISRFLQVALMRLRRHLCSVRLIQIAARLFELVSGVYLCINLTTCLKKTEVLFNLKLDFI